MLQITREQFAAFESAAAAAADRQLASYLRDRFPAWVHERSDRELAQVAGDVRQRARQYGIADEPDVATALDLTVMYGPDFYHADWAGDVFSMADWDGARKLDVVRERVRRQVPSF